VRTIFFFLSGLENSKVIGSPPERVWSFSRYWWSYSDLIPIIHRFGGFCFCFGFQLLFILLKMQKFL